LWSALEPEADTGKQEDPAIFGTASGANGGAATGGMSFHW